VTENSHWGTNSGGYNSFLGLLVDEIGSPLQLDRLTVFLANSNKHKGKLFGGKTAVSDAKFTSYDTGDEQLILAREVGMVFHIHESIIRFGNRFCDSYNGVLDCLEEFDAWYPTTTGATSNLAGEWPKFIRSELDMVVTNGRTNLRMMNTRKKQTPLQLGYYPRWVLVMTTEMAKV